MNFYKVIVVVLLFASCQPTKQETKVVEVAKALPVAVQKVLSQHGGIELWDKMRSMSFELVKEPKNELQEIDLWTRSERIEGNNFTTGYDGKQVWVHADTTYKGNPVFYHNLMFYFVAMPFVLVDDGIIYSDVDDLVFDDKSYPGVKISYEAEVGFSSQDEYFLHYDSETGEMAWLGYTVTYFSGKKTADVHWIRYDDWVDYNGLKLPNSMTWYNYEEGLPTEKRNQLEIVYKRLSSEAFPEAKFVMPEGGKYVE